MKRGEALPPPTLGEGCLLRYDPEALSPDDGAEFADAAALWQQLQTSDDSAAPRVGAGDKDS